MTMKRPSSMAPLIESCLRVSDRSSRWCRLQHACSASPRWVAALKTKFTALRYYLSSRQDICGQHVCDRASLLSHHSTRSFDSIKPSQHLISMPSCFLVAVVVLYLHFSVHHLLLARLNFHMRLLGPIAYHAQQTPHGDQSLHNNCTSALSAP